MIKFLSYLAQKTYSRSVQTGTKVSLNKLHYYRSAFYTKLFSTNSFMLVLIILHSSNVRNSRKYNQGQRRSTCDCSLASILGK